MNIIVVVSKEILEVMNDLVEFLRVCLPSIRNFIILVFLDVNLVLYIQLAILGEKH